MSVPPDEGVWRKGRAVDGHLLHPRVVDVGSELGTEVLRIGRTVYVDRVDELDSRLRVVVVDLILRARAHGVGLRQETVLGTGVTVLEAVAEVAR